MKMTLWDEEKSSQDSTRDNKENVRMRQEGDELRMCRNRHDW